MKNIFTLTFLLISFFSLEAKNDNNKKALIFADSLLYHIIDVYSANDNNLLLETYPKNSNQKISYLAQGTEKKVSQPVSFLWPYSGMLSGVTNLYIVTSNKKYLDLLKKNILPGLEQYWDNNREPACYQSFPTKYGEHGRYYDDNVWIALDYCDLYSKTKDKDFLNKAVQLYNYIFSGWDNRLGGGIFWCEQQKVSKNSCSNAPATVLCAKLFQLTKNDKYLEQAKATYQWTKNNLLDPSDYLVWDNIKLNGTIDKTKFSYNSGQMLNAAAILYKITKEEDYLFDAKKMAANIEKHFRTKTAKNNPNLKIYRDMGWFNVIMFRGFKALYEIDNNPEYLSHIKENIEYVINNNRDENGLVGKDWSGNNNEKHKWLLDNACLIEIFAQFGALDIK
ncbi:MAG: glycoside hydrolase family 76 protein [Bacteroidales bacterium]|nr:glycoside hydrolase family 76 protein [Bacteroidales bacterium]